MTMTLAPHNVSVRSLTQALALAASPGFALMGWLSYAQTPANPLCGSGASPIDGMTTMYLMMTVFHLAPWLKLASLVRE